MKLSRRTTAIVLMLCLLILQTQVWASTLLGCQHEAGLGMAGMPSCHQHHVGHLNPEPLHSKLLDCHKCALHCLVAVAVPMSSPPLALDALGPQAPVAVLGLHFYDHVSALPERPPRV